MGKEEHASKKAHHRIKKKHKKNKKSKTTPLHAQAMQPTLSAPQDIQLLISPTTVVQAKQLGDGHLGSVGKIGAYGISHHASSGSHVSATLIWIPLFTLLILYCMQIK
ncbi:hypothetical protein G6F46_005248 [Rhizopus delemar]|uniref:Uncharacterized protein n=3 Tax=Rhizopus TaxID=4842 RepID=I1BLN9_RHIO9|nr:hypothetical protein RO3G_01823 [Rhizopus delemar RA 99-880]KAG1447891.1 hypothetical protein G6F55_010906 [Rhizopus delemar]KAG1546550.1 hypothetical protein G6F51_004805 [Rhizopus arrhizus]KAG1489934.1 hypothetical protein G6F54_011084 [Rhizopus delemar]KAG1500646.1 hypothetical protein G6F53_011256 [Rhizopus delemar]|eukprot:EIE77119.1 hypothetical protein RO3G_01823 [Rhizopus delemar RA 99-880]